MGVPGRLIMMMMPITPKFVVHWVAKRYVAGPDLDSAIKVMRAMKSQGACFTLDVLGEEITSLAEAEFFVNEYHRALDAIVAEGMDANISLKPTAFGLLIDEEKAIENIEHITRIAAKNDIFVRLDMEDNRVTQSTIDIVTEMHERGHRNIGTVLQSRLFRTSDDIAHLSSKLGGNSDVRICKGIYLEPEDIAHTGYHEIVAATNQTVDELLDAGSYTAIATHDIPVINYSLTSLAERGMGPGIEDPRSNAGQARKGKGPGYEFQMLLGVRGNIRRKLSAQGHRTRVYIPYGGRWYEYSMRRLRENPDVAWHVAKSIIMPWTNRR
ncbi:MAG: proline dehydrogenase family protein [Candidatus Thalassarchaeum sp.]|nr:proline dehydrogenase family protein [Candidatus Thalassarchaeum sp.]MCS5531490.1 proline dehydrogenase family protein [Candidatus Poseidoniales archaeon]MEC9350842.1 proline dehydrogenase family protein [Candidatus Thermoplasmatota archaeon]|tara:strand:- start:307 stop:1281 length:975 start_codon:yes stop_codon:yes gene_type:complete